MNNNQENSMAFLEKVKKQAKRLLKISKTNNLKVEINNLSEAQNIVAQINGYPDWHALSKNLNSNTVVNENINDLIVNSTNNSLETINLDLYNGIYALENQELILSFFELRNFPLEFQEAQNWINELKEKLSFNWNMEFHKVKIYLNFSKKEEEINTRYNVFKWSNILGINEEEFNQLFSINLNPKINNFGLKVTVVVSTISGMLLEHVSFCKLFKDNFINKKRISKEDALLLMSNYQEEENQIKNFEGNISLEKFIGSKDTDNFNWLYGIYNIFLRKTATKIVLSITPEKTEIEKFISENSEKNLIFLNGLWNSLNKKSYGSFEIEERMNLIFENEYQNESNKKGIPFINSSDENIMYLGNGYSTTENKIIFSRPGGGKSSLLNILNYDNILKNSEDGVLPYACFIDIGPSNKGIIDLLKNTVKDSLKEQIQYYKIKMSKEFVVNPFETQLGHRFPTPLEEESLVNLLLLLIAEFSEDKPIEGMMGLVQAVIKDMYRKLSDKENPKKYDRGVVKIVDQILDKLNAPIDYLTCWWDVVDLLFKNGYEYEAKVAQRYAVPLLADVMMSAQEEKIRNIYSKVIVPLTGENLIQYFNRSIVDSLNEFPVFAIPTTFDIGDNKIVCLDLDEVSKPGGFREKRITEVMYLYASIVAARQTKMFFNSVIFSEANCPKLYESYYKNKRNNLNKMHSITFDEFHRAGSSFSVMNQITNFTRNSRKYNFSIIVGTQSVDDFEKIAPYCSTVLVPTGEFYNANAANRIIKAIDLKDEGVKYDLKSKKFKFGSFLVKEITNRGEVEKIINLQLSSYLIWMLSSTFEDAWIKNKLIEKIGFFKAIKLLSQKFNNSAKPEVEKRRELNPLLSSEDILNGIVEEVLS